MEILKNNNKELFNELMCIDYVLKNKGAKNRFPYFEVRENTAYATDSRNAIRIKNIGIEDGYYIITKKLKTKIIIDKVIRNPLPRVEQVIPNDEANECIYHFKSNLDKKTTYILMAKYFTYDRFYFPETFSLLDILGGGTWDIYLYQWAPIRMDYKDITFVSMYTVTKGELEIVKQKIKKEGEKNV